jgi:hypothetical protein
MFMFKKPKPGLLPLSQENKEIDEMSERDAMLDHDYLGTKPLSRSRRIWSSNIPWILTTIGLSIYIFTLHSSQQKTQEPWSPTDVGKFGSIKIEGNSLS